MTMRLFLTVLAASLLTACSAEQPAGNGGANTPATNGEAATSQPVEKTGAIEGERMKDDAFDYFGAGVADGQQPALLADVVANPDEFTGKPIQLKADAVTAVCKKKGCWMTFGPEDEAIRVKFKDYGFFVPLDCEGREAIVEGELTVTTMSVEEVKHYLEDAGKLDEAAKVTEPKKELQFVATGVALRKS